MLNVFVGKLIQNSVRDYEIFHGFIHRKSLYQKFKPVLLISRSCSSLDQVTESPSEPPKRKYKTPVDWLPFEWHRRPRRNYFAESGDYVQTLEYDPAWPKPDFELSEELKIANDDIKYMFSLATASKADIKEVVKRNYLKNVQRHPNDLQSLEVKIALKTLQIRGLFDHAREKKRDVRGSRIVLHNLIHKRNKMLKILYRIDSETFDWLTKELQLYYVPEKLGGRKEAYCKKWDLRRLTREYCENTVNDKKKAYHEELKEQQINFLKEKEEIMAWIDKEEKELAKLDIK